MWRENPAPVRNPSAVDERARDLAAAGLNGLRAVLVDVNAAGTSAVLELHFFNDLHVADILAEATNGPGPADVFPVAGGHRVRAGRGAGEVSCVAVGAGPTSSSLELVLEQVGDYSTYTLELAFDPERVDPFFATLAFKFRPGCFTNDCGSVSDIARARPPVPAIDYLAKDYDSFRHVLIAAMMDSVPGWQVASEADLDQVLIDLFAAAADELSDYQDRVMAEAFLGTARSRVSLARHARLMDYHLHHGQQSSTWLQITVAEGAIPFVLDGELVAWTGGPDDQGDAQFFATRETTMPRTSRTTLAPGFNAFHLHTWTGAQPALRTGATEADLVPAPTATAPDGLVTAAEIADAVNNGLLARLLVAEVLNPLTGRSPGADRRARQVIHLVSATVLRDPLAGLDVVRVVWADQDMLRRDYAFTITCPDGPVDNVSVFAGNLVRVHHGLPVVATFHAPGTILSQGGPVEWHGHWEAQVRYGETRAALADLPPELTPLAYLPISPGGVVPSRSTLQVSVESGTGDIDEWDEVPSLVHSDDSAENGDHFVVETDEHRRTRLRFGNGTNGRLLPAGSVVRAAYQVGGGVAGNVGAETITDFAPLDGALAGVIEAVSNPVDVTDGLDPEPATQVLRNAPEAYRTRQLRAITLADYIARAEEVDDVQRAAASYAWTGSWRTVRIVLDPKGTTELSAELAAATAGHLEAVRLIGEDLEIRPPRYVPLTVECTVCLRADVWPEDVRDALRQEFSDGWTATGEQGFFHPDRWTFGQSLHRSQVAERLMKVAGLDHVVSIGMRRRDSAAPSAAEILETAFDEIILVRNDPDHLERGSITFDLCGGRR
ncbi:MULTISPECIES: putative baseplate assembly protein [Citricoccus]|uniref:putative baseplate assembly protein n=1 Tax=Citricoccus TaxID=169133 RepID=UPI000255F12F|nr:putative baseplate assembly protein [Citricoccus sp. CH26A]